MQETIDLEILCKGEIEGIAESFGDYMRDNTVASLLSQGHVSGVVLRCQGESTDGYFQLKWLTKSELVAASFKDRPRTTDFGAMGIGVLLTLHLTEYDSFETSYTGSGIDFWLAKKGSFLETNSVAALEVTGIGKASRKNTIQNRLKLKLSQVKPTSEQGIPVFVAIIEFGKPEALFQKV